LKLTQRDIQIMGLLRFGVIEENKLYRMMFAKLSKDTPEAFASIIQDRANKASIEKKAIMDEMGGMVLKAIHLLDGDDVSGIQAEILAIAKKIDVANKRLHHFTKGLRQISRNLGASIQTSAFQKGTVKERQQMLARIIGERVDRLKEEVEQNDAMQRLKLRGRRAMRRLVDDRLVREYKRKTYEGVTLYYQLTDLGVSVVVSDLNDSASFLDRDMIRSKMTPIASLVHEDAVSAVMRSLYLHSSRHGYYIEYMYDEAALKKVYGRKKGVFYPDVQVRIKAAGPGGGVKIYNIEVDNATQPTRILERKIDPKYPLIILCLSNDRANELFRRLVLVGGHNDGFLIGEHKAFVKSGMFQCTLLSPPKGDLVHIGMPRGTRTAA